MNIVEAVIFQARTDLSDVIPLYVPLVKGADYAVLIDTGVKSMFPELMATMRAAGIGDEDLRFVLHTHSHHDHIGCNAQLKAQTDCLIAAHRLYAAWHSDFERHYQEFARPFPHLIPDTPALREEVLGILDGEHKVDLYIDEGVCFDLGGVTLEAYSLPGHMKAELGWFESSTRTLILGDAITGLDWPIFHSHLSVRSYRESLEKIRRIIPERAVERVLFAHFPPMEPGDALCLTQRADAYIDEVEATLIRLLAAQDTVTLEELWTGLCKRMGRLKEFRSLNMVFAHMEDLLERGLIQQVADETYCLR